jgi:hypothetical protein
MVVVGMVVLAVLPAQPLPEHRRADRDHEQPRDQSEPRVELLGKDELREPEGHDPDREDPGRVGHGDGAPEHERVPRRALRSDEVRGHERLAVPRGQRVRGSPEAGDQERREEDAERDLPALDQTLEPAGVGYRLRLRARGDPGWRSRPVSRLEGRRRARDVERRPQQVARIAPERIALADAGDGRVDDTGAVTRRHRHLAPADAAGEGTIRERELRAMSLGHVGHFEPERLEAAGARSGHDAVLERSKRSPAAVE